MLSKLGVLLFLNIFTITKSQMLPPDLGFSIPETTPSTTSDRTPTIENEDSTVPEGGNEGESSDSVDAEVVTATTNGRSSTETSSTPTTAGSSSNPDDEECNGFVMLCRNLHAMERECVNPSSVCPSDTNQMGACICNGIDVLTGEAMSSTNPENTIPSDRVFNRLEDQNKSPTNQASNLSSMRSFIIGFGFIIISVLYGPSF